MARVLGVIGARLNSSRLPAKHLLNLAGQPMISRIFQRLERISQLNHLVLATTSDDYNLQLVEWAQGAGKDVFAFEGDVNDVIGRVDAVVRQYDADIICYFCGDSPLIEPETVSRMISGLIDNPEAQHVVLEASANGNPAIHEGFSPYRRSTWSKLVETAVSQEEREHVGLSLQHCLDSLRSIAIQDDPVFSRLNHRISVDTAADYRFMSEAYRRWYENNSEDTIVSLPWLIKEMESDAGLRAINEHVVQKGVADSSYKILIVTQCGSDIGLGHLSRSLVVASGLMESIGAGVQVLIQGKPVARSELNMIRHQFVESSLVNAVHDHLDDDKNINAVIFDLAPKKISDDFEGLLHKLRQRDVVVVAIDGMFEQARLLDLIHVPSFFLDNKHQSLTEREVVSFGWQNYLLPRHDATCTWKTGNQVLVMTGGSDIDELGKTWPLLLEKLLPEGSVIHWVQGPYAKTLVLPKDTNKRWVCHDSPSNLGELMKQANYGLIVYGVSLFEMLSHGIPCVTVMPGFSQTSKEARAFQEEHVAVVSTKEKAVEDLAVLMGDIFLAQKISSNACAQLCDNNGVAILASKIKDLIDNI